MNVTDIGNLYLKNSSLMGASGVSSATTNIGKSGSSFELMLEAAAKAEAAASSAKDVKDSAFLAQKGLPIGAAANSGATDAVHASKKPTTIDRTSKLYEQCRELETFIVKSLLDGMRKTVQKSGFMDEGFAGQMYEDMLYDEYAESLTKNAGFGLADQAYLELSGARGHT